MLYDPSRAWNIAETEIILTSDAGHDLYIKVPIADGLVTSEVFASVDHIDPLRDDDFVIYKIGYIPAAINGKRGAFAAVFGNSAPAIKTASGILTNLLSRLVSVNFTFEFPSIPVGRGNLYAYRSTEIEPGKIGDQSVLIHSLSVTKTGFSLVIDDSEDLTGIIIEYNFIQRS